MQREEIPAPEKNVKQKVGLEQSASTQDEEPFSRDSDMVGEAEGILNWSCFFCTFENGASASKCEMCLSPKKVLHTSVRPIAMFIPPPPFQCLPSKQSLMQGKRKRARKKIALSGGKGDEQSEKMDDFDEMSMILNHTRMEEPLSHADLEPKYPYASGLMFLDPWLQQCNSQSIRMVCWVVRELQANKLSIPERVVMYNRIVLMINSVVKMLG
jgi:hypothetical protein